jgi:hypothetical protein
LPLYALSKIFHSDMDIRLESNLRLSIQFILQIIL